RSARAAAGPRAALPRLRQSSWTTLPDRVAHSVIAPFSRRTGGRTSSQPPLVVLIWDGGRHRARPLVPRGRTGQIPRFCFQYTLMAVTVLAGSGPKAIERAMSWPFSKPQRKNRVTSPFTAFGASVRRICQVQPEIGQLCAPG